MDLGLSFRMGSGVWGKVRVRVMVRVKVTVTVTVAVTVTVTVTVTATVTAGCSVGALPHHSIFQAPHRPVPDYEPWTLVLALPPA